MLKNDQPKESTNLRAKWVLSLWRPQPGPNESVTGRYSAQNIEQQRDGIVGNILGVRVAGVGDGDATAAALGDVNMVDACARSHHEPKGGKEIEHVGGHWGQTYGDEGPYGCGVAGQESLRWLVGGRGERIEEAEVAVQAVPEWESIRGEAMQQDERPMVSFFSHNVPSSLFALLTVFVSFEPLAVDLSLSFSFSFFLFMVEIPILVFDFFW